MKMTPRFIYVLSVGLILFSNSAYSNEPSNRYYAMSERPDTSSEDNINTPNTSPEIQHGNRPYSVLDILNQPVGDKSEMCPKRNVLLFFITGDVRNLAECLKSNAAINKTSQMTSQENQMERESDGGMSSSYSGRLLKRILQNMGDGTVKVNFGGENNPGQTPEKRARLSVNSALSSLADMLRHESRGHRRKQFAFHNDLLHMG